jgi:hypothetical protein
MPSSTAGMSHGEPPPLKGGKIRSEEEVEGRVRG